MLAGGSEASIIPSAIGGFIACKALSKRNDDPAAASRPWDQGRDGFVMGEGAGAWAWRCSCVVCGVVGNRRTKAGWGGGTLAVQSPSCPTACAPLLEMLRLPSFPPAPASLPPAPPAPQLLPPPPTCCPPGVLVLEELEHAKARGAPILAEFVGGAFTCDAHHMTEPEPAGRGVIMCIERALAKAGVAPEQVRGGGAG